MASIRDVAKLAQVAPSTVSLVLNVMPKRTLSTLGLTTQTLVFTMRTPQQRSLFLCNKLQAVTTF